MSESVLVIVQNLPVPLDRRVWLECQALRDAGYDVAVICPKGPGDPNYERLDGISLYKYAGPPTTSGLLSYLFEFAYCWLRTFFISFRVYRQHHFSVIQACNPPDTYWLLARFWKLRGVKFVFDQHDLNPELFRSRFGDPKKLFAKMQFAVLLWLERMTYRTADHVIVTNDSYRQIARGRGRRDAADVTIVRSGPDTRQMRPVPGRPEMREGAGYLLAYLGIMGPQDNVDVLLRSVHHLVHKLGRTDVHVALMGFGDAVEQLKELATELEITDWVTFTGRADQKMIADYLSSAHIGLCPDLKTPLNDVSTHNKVMEYMAYALPIVSFDLAETRHSAGDFAVYVESGDTEAYAIAIDRLLDDADRRAELGRGARARCVGQLDWRSQIGAYVGVFDKLFNRPALPAPVEQPEWPVVDRRRPQPDADPGGDVVVAGRGVVIDLRDPDLYGDFLLTRESKVRA